MINKKTIRPLLLFICVSLITACGDDQENEANNNQVNTGTEQRELSAQVSNGIWKGLVSVDSALTAATFTFYNGRAWAFLIEGDANLQTAFGDVNESGDDLSASFSLYQSGGNFNGSAQLTASVNQDGVIRGSLASGSEQGEVTLFEEKFVIDVLASGTLERQWTAYDIETGIELASFSVNAFLSSRVKTLDGCDFMIPFKDTGVNGLLVGVFMTSGCSTFAAGNYQAILAVSTISKNQVKDILIGISSLQDANSGTLLLAQ